MSRRLLSLGAIQLAGLALRYLQLVLFARMLTVAEFGIYSTVWAVIGWTSVLVMGGWSSTFLAHIPKYGFGRAQHRDAQLTMIKRFVVVGLLQSVLLWTFFREAMGPGVILSGSLALLAMSLGSAMAEAWRAFGVILWSRWLLAAFPTVIPATLLGVFHLLHVPITAAWVLASLAVGWSAMWFTGSIRTWILSEPDTGPGVAPATSRRDFLAIKLSQALLGTADIMIVSAITTVEDAALYSVATRVAVIAGFALNIVTMYYGPKISAAASDAQRLRALTRATTRLSVLLSLPVIIALALCAPLILSAFGDEYRGAAPLLWIMLIGTGANALFGPVGTVVNVNGQEGVSRSVMMVAAVVFLVATTAATLAFGPVGAAVASSATTLCWNIALWIALDYHALEKKARRGR